MKPMTFKEKIDAIQLACGAVGLIGLITVVIGWGCMVEFNHHYTLWRLTGSITEYDLALLASEKLQRATNILNTLWITPGVGIIVACLLEGIKPVEG